MAASKWITLARGPSADKSVACPCCRIELTGCAFIIATLFLVAPTLAASRDSAAPMQGLADDADVADVFEKRARANMGFVGMRGKKLTNADSEEEELSLPPGMYDYEKRAPTRGFHGMRGKKARSMGFMGMRGKKDYFQNEEPQDAEIDGLLNLLLDEREREEMRSKRFTRPSAWRTRGAKKAPLMGFVGMRGKRDPSIAPGNLPRFCFSLESTVWPARR